MHVAVNVHVSPCEWSADVAVVRECAGGCIQSDIGINFHMETMECDVCRSADRAHQLKAARMQVASCIDTGGLMSRDSHVPRSAAEVISSLNNRLH